MLYCDEVRKLLLKYSGYKCAVCLCIVKRMQTWGSHAGCIPSAWFQRCHTL